MLSWSEWKYKVPLSLKEQPLVSLTLRKNLRSNYITIQQTSQYNIFILNLGIIGQNL